MHTIVVGCGRVGSELAINLERLGHSVAVVDKNRRAFQRYLPERWTGRAVLGFGFDRDHLEQAGIREAGALAAATSGDLVAQEGDILHLAVRKEALDELEEKLGAAPGHTH